MKQNLLSSGLVAVLVIGIVASGCLGSSHAVVTNGSEQQLVDQIDTLQQENTDLHQQLDRQNLTVSSYEDQLAFYRGMTSGTVASFSTGSAVPVIGTASLEAPAVLQRSVYGQNGPFMTEQTVEEGSLLNVTVDIVPGRGRVLVNTTPLMGTTFQDAANTAAHVAQQKTGVNLSASDVIVSIVAEDQVPAVDGGSAGALMTLLMISAIEGVQPHEGVIMTGTIDQDGNVGAIGGVVEKATAAREAGKTVLLLPRENSQLVRYAEQTRTYYGRSFVQRVPEQIDAKQYIEAEIGIPVEYVDTIDDVLRLVR